MNCWECYVKFKYPESKLVCDHPDCERYVCLECYEIYYPSDAMNERTSEGSLYCNEHYPHICSWCGVPQPSILCCLCSEESIKQYMCENCFHIENLMYCSNCENGDGLSDGSNEENKIQSDFDDDYEGAETGH